MTADKHQMSRHSRSGAAPVGWRNCVEAPVADEAQGRAHVRTVGRAISGLCRSGVSLFDDLPVNWPGLRARPFSHSLCACPRPLAGAAHRRLGLLASRCRDANLTEFPRLFICGRAQQFRITQEPGSDRADPFHSSKSFRGVTFQRPNRDTQRIVNVQQAVGEIRNV